MRQSPSFTERPSDERGALLPRVHPGERQSCKTWRLGLEAELRLLCFVRLRLPLTEAGRAFGDGYESPERPLSVSNSSPLSLSEKQEWVLCVYTLQLTVPPLDPSDRVLRRSSDVSIETL